MEAVVHNAEVVVVARSLVLEDLAKVPAGSRRSSVEEVRRSHHHCMVVAAMGYRIV